MLRHSESGSYGSYTHRQPPTNGLYAQNGSTSVTLRSKEPIDRLLGELERPAGYLSTVRTVIDVGPGATLRKKELSRYVHRDIRTFKLFIAHWLTQCLKLQCGYCVITASLNILLCACVCFLIRLLYCTRYHAT